MIRATFGQAADEALCIARHESGLRPDATHHNSDGSTDFGVFQLNSVHFRAGLDQNRVFDAAYNIQYAYHMWKQQGNWHAWTTHTVCGL